jgi:hypothetical protein
MAFPKHTPPERRRIFHDEEEYYDVVNRFCLMLEHATMGRMSKHNYTIEAMRSEIDAANSKFYYDLVKSDIMDIIDNDGDMDEIKKYLNELID